MTNADGTTGCSPPGRGFESRRVRHYGPVAQRIERDVSSNLVVMPDDFCAASAATGQKGTEQIAANAGWNYSTITGYSVRFDSSPCWRSLARAGLPVFHHPLSPRRLTKHDPESGIRFSAQEMANAGRTTGIEHPQRKLRKVGCSNHPFRLRMESSSVIVLPTLVARPNE